LFRKSFDEKNAGSTLYIGLNPSHNPRGFSIDETIAANEEASGCATQ
jgi:hypothetical protein